MQVVYVFCFWFLPSVGMRFLTICMCIELRFRDVQFCKIVIPTLGEKQKHESERSCAQLCCKTSILIPAECGDRFFDRIYGSFVALRKWCKFTKYTYFWWKLMILRIRNEAVLANPNFDWISFVFYSVYCIWLCKACWRLQIVHVNNVWFFVCFITFIANYRK